MKQISQVLKSNGTDGELVMGFQGISPEDIDTKEPVFITFDGLPVPFFIESLVRRGTGRALVHLTDIRSFEDAEELVGRKVMAELHDEDAEDDLSVLVGWTLINSPQSPDYSPDAESAEQEVPLTEVGTITDFIDIPNNPCIEVETKNGTVMIPLHEDLIISLDPDSEEIIMSLPDGLLE